MGSGLLGGMSRERFFLFASIGSFLWCKSILCVVDLEMGLSWWRRFFPWVPVYVVSLEIRLPMRGLMTL